MSTMNGHLSDTEGDRLGQSSLFERSGSELSDLNGLPATSLPLDTEMNGVEHSDDDAIYAMATSELEEDEDAPGEEVEDFSAGTPPQDTTDRISPEPSPQSDSSRPSKRKAVMDEEDYIKQNPELYGLRRSGRARPTRRVVDSSDEDDEEEDISNGRRRKRQKIAAARPTSTKVVESAPSPTSEAESESEDDTYGGQRGRTFARKHRKKLQAATSGHDTPNLSEVRFSTRKAAKVTTYNEDDDHAFSEEDDEDMTPNYGATVDDNRPAIDSVLNHRLKEGVDSTAATKHDFDFYIKWQGQAHFHATWKAWPDLKTYKGFRRLENYYKKIVVEDLRALHDPNVALEDRERWNLDREAYIDSLNDYMKVERVISRREGEQGTEYYVKWKSLPYDSCTWEAASLVSELSQNQIDRYLDRSSKLPTSNLNESRLSTRSEYKPFWVQPSYIKGGELREFQIHGLNFLCHHWCKGNHVILADEMGLGKTVQTVAFMNWLRHDRNQQGPFLVVVPLSTMPAWAETFNVWTPDLNYVVYNGNEAAREIIREHDLLVDGKTNKIRFNVLLTTYEYILADAVFLSQIKWQFLAVDEAHRLKNRDSQLYAKLMDFSASSRLLITGTPMQNTLGELSALLNFIMPGEMHIDESIDFKSETADLDQVSKQLAELNDTIAPYILRRTKQKVESDLPPKTEMILRVGLAGVQTEYYQNIFNRNYEALNAGSKANKTSLLNVMMELKKASNHPFLFPNAEERILDRDAGREDQLKALITTSGKMMLLDKLLTKLKKDGHRVLIFSQMVRMLDILGDYLQLRGYQFQRLDGTIAAGPRRAAIEHFNASNSEDFCFLLSTRAGGLGINLMTADTVILFDSDWNPQADLQAMARAHRIGQQKPVNVYRLISTNTIETDILIRAQNKLVLDYVTIQRGMTDNKDAKELGNSFAKASVATTEPTSTEDISRILKLRAKKILSSTGDQKELEELDIDAVLANAEVHHTDQPEGMTLDGGEEFLKSFEYTDVKLDELSWDDIIPKEQLDKIKGDLSKKQEEEYLASVIEQNQPRKRKAAATDLDKGRAAKKRANNSFAATVGDDDSDPDNDDSEPGQDPKRPLNERDVRFLVKAHERWGSMEDMEDTIIKTARLTGRDIGTIKSTLQEILDAARQTVKDHEDRLAEAQKTTNKPAVKKDDKAIQFDFRGVKGINAENVLNRPDELRMIRQVVAGCPDWRSFRLPEASKAASYTCDWGAREDGMLCVGIAKHGMGAWVQIRDDEELGMSDKMFLDENKVSVKEQRRKAEGKVTAKLPGSVHLLRRAAYLISVLKDKLSNGTNIEAKKQLENHHRNHRKQTGQANGKLGTPAGERSATPKKPNANDQQRQNDRAKPRQSAQHQAGPFKANGNALAPPQDKVEVETRRLLEPLAQTLEHLSRITKKRYPDKGSRLDALKAALRTIGKHISSQLAQTGDDIEEGRAWHFISQHFWPKRQGIVDVSGAKLKDMYEKVAWDIKNKGSALPSDSKSNDTKSDSRPRAKTNNSSSKGKLPTEDQEKSAVPHTKTKQQHGSTNVSAPTKNSKPSDSPPMKAASNLAATNGTVHKRTPKSNASIPAQELPSFQRQAPGARRESSGHIPAAFRRESSGSRPISSESMRDGRASFRRESPGFRRDSSGSRPGPFGNIRDRNDRRSTAFGRDDPAYQRERSRGRYESFANRRESSGSRPGTSSGTRGRFRDESAGFRRDSSAYRRDSSGSRRDSYGSRPGSVDGRNESSTSRPGSAGGMRRSSELKRKFDRFADSTTADAENKPSKRKVDHADASAGMKAGQEKSVTRQRENGIAGSHVGSAFSSESAERKAEDPRKSVGSGTTPKTPTPPQQRSPKRKLEDAADPTSIEGATSSKYAKTMAGQKAAPAGGEARSGGKPLGAVDEDEEL